MKRVILLSDFGFISQEVSKTKEVVLEVVLLQPKSVFTRDLRAGGCKIAMRLLMAASEPFRRKWLAPYDEVAQAALYDIVLQILAVRVALTKDAGTKQRAKKDSIDVAGPGDGRQP